MFTKDGAGVPTVTHLDRMGGGGGGHCLLDLPHEPATPSKAFLADLSTVKKMLVLRRLRPQLVEHLALDLMVVSSGLL